MGQLGAGKALHLANSRLLKENDSENSHLLSHFIVLLHFLFIFDLTGQKSA
jgi:hypothetical protein